MAGSKFYNMWLWSGAAWVSVPNFTDLNWNIGINQIGAMSVTVYTRDSTTQALLALPGTHYRITNKTSNSNGWAYYETATVNGITQAGLAGNYVIQHGQITTPGGDKKTVTATNGNPVIWNVEGIEIGEQVTKMTFDPTVGGDPTSAVSYSSTIDNIITSDIIPSINSNNHRAGGAQTVIAQGSIDGDGGGGPNPDTINMTLKQEKAYQLLLDLANIGKLYQSVSILYIRKGINVCQTIRLR